MGEIIEDKAIRATYEEAIGFLDNSMKGKVRNIFDDPADGSAVIAEIVGTSIWLECATETVAFVFGTTGRQIKSDMLKFREEHHDR